MCVYTVSPIPPWPAPAVSSEMTLSVKEEDKMQIAKLAEALKKPLVIPPGATIKTLTKKDGVWVAGN